MKKINSCGALLYERFCKHNLKMKLTTILMIVSLFQIQANTYSQNAKVTLNLENVTVEEVFSDLVERMEKEQASGKATPFAEITDEDIDNLFK